MICSVICARTVDYSLFSIARVAAPLAAKFSWNRCSICSITRYAFTTNMQFRNTILSIIPAQSSRLNFTSDILGIAVNPA